MTTTPRLLYGFLSQSSEAINLTIPWAASDQDGLFRMNYSKEEAVKTNLIAWAKTNRGERPMRFDFGLDTRRYLFEPEEIAKEQLKNRARQQLSKYFSYLQIVKLDVLTSSDTNLENTIKFILEVKFSDEEEGKVIKVSVDVGG